MTSPRATVALAVGAALTWVAPALAAVSDSYSAGPAGPHPQAIALAEAEGGTVLTVKLTLDKSAKVLLARLYVTRGPAAAGADLTDEIRIYPGANAAGKPLALVGPWFDHFDAAEAVRSAVQADGQLKLLVKPFPNWRKENTRLEVWYEGKGGAGPQQAPPPVKDVKLLHRAGQTFITWREANPPAASDTLTYGQYKKALAEAANPVCYRIYVHDKPITAETILSARLSAEAPPLSAWNVNGRNMEYLIGQALDKPDEVGELAANYAGLMYTWGPDSPRMDRYRLARFVIDDSAGPLPPGTGLYVHTPGAAGKRYYAVVACVNGVENLADFSPANAPDKGVDEIAGVGEPVCQGDGLWGPFFDYPGRRKVYVQWCGPPLSGLPSTYFNWSVLAPPERQRVLEVPQPETARQAKPPLRPAELCFHSGGFSYAQPRQKYLLESIQFAPHDYPASGWYGFNSSYGTLKGYGAGLVSNHTQRRLIAFLDWAKAKFPVDPERVLLSGGDGAALLALNYPDVFSYAVVTGFESVLAPPEKSERPGRGPDPAARADALFGPIWGPKSPDLKDDQGRGDWSWAMLDALVAARPQRDLPLFSCSCPSWGLFVAGFGKGTGRFYSALEQARQPVTVNWSWGGGLPLVPDKYTGLWRGLDLTRQAPVIAFANCTADANQDGNGQINGFCNWSGLKESPDGLEVTLSGRGAADVTPRRCRAFQPKSGENFDWEATPLPDARAKSQPAPQTGQASADAHGSITLKGVALNNAVLLKLARAK